MKGLRVDITLGHVRLVEYAYVRGHGCPQTYRDVLTSPTNHRKTAKEIERRLSLLKGGFNTCMKFRCSVFRRFLLIAYVDMESQ